MINIQDKTVREIALEMPVTTPFLRNSRSTIAAMGTRPLTRLAATSGQALKPYCRRSTEFWIYQRVVIMDRSPKWV